jgi:hypothetical protein
LTSPASKSCLPQLIRYPPGNCPLSLKGIAATAAAKAMPYPRDANQPLQRPPTPQRPHLAHVPEEEPLVTPKEKITLQPPSKPSPSIAIWPPPSQKIPPPNTPPEQNPSRPPRANGHSRPGAIRTATSTTDFRMTQMPPARIHQSPQCEPHNNGTRDAATPVTTHDAPPPSTYLTQSLDKCIH